MCAFVACVCPDIFGIVSEPYIRGGIRFLFIVKALKMTIGLP